MTIPIENRQFLRCEAAFIRKFIIGISPCHQWQADYTAIKVRAILGADAESLCP